MTFGLDYSAGRPSGAAIRAAGYNFVVRYLDNGLGGSRANLTAAEAADLRNAGVDVALVWERKLLSGPDRATQGRAAGAADAAAAVAQARACGLDGWPIYFAIDFDMPDYAPAATSPLTKLGPVGDYFGGIRATLPLERVGVYGSFYAVGRVRAAGLASWTWQTMAWSGGQVDTAIHLLQRLGTVTVGGVDCDVNEAKQPQFGQSAAQALTTTTPGDIVFEFIANTDGPLQDPTKPFSGSTAPLNGYAQVKLLLGGGLLGPATWADVHAKDHAYAGDGTGSVLGIGATQYQAYLDTDTAVRAAYAKLAGLGVAGAAGATPAEVTAIVGEALDHLTSSSTFHTP